MDTIEDKMEGGKVNTSHEGKRKKEKEAGNLRHRKKGSLTVECAFILPLFFLAAAVLASMLDLYRIGTLVQSALCEGAKELGMYAYAAEEGEEGIVSSSVCAVYGKQKIKEKLEGDPLLGIRGGIGGISLLGTRYEDQTILLKASFSYKSPIGIFSLAPVRIQVQGEARAWTGYGGELYGSEGSEELVYLSDWESVYHTSASCTHLRLDIEKVSAKEAEERRNIYGSVYKPCEKCTEGGISQGQVYITSSGDRIHQDPNCSGLTRHVKTVKKSETEGLRACSRCGGN